MNGLGRGNYKPEDAEESNHWAGKPQGSRIRYEKAASYRNGGLVNYRNGGPINDRDGGPVRQQLPTSQLLLE